MKLNISLSGSGGQGLILAGVLLAQAVVKDGKNVALTSSYGPESRGGASRSNLVVSDEPIVYPVPEGLDILLTMNQESCDTYLPELREEGILIIDSSQVIHRPPMRHYSVPFTTIATQIGAAVAANMIALGAIVELTGIVKPSSLEEALTERIRNDLLTINKEAMRNGLGIGRKLKNNIIEYYRC